MDEEKIICEFCNEYSGTSQQVRMHKFHCKSKPPETKPPDEKPPERERPNAERKERVPFGSPKNKLSSPENDGYHYHYFNDNWRKEPGRIQRAINAGYEKVEGVEPIPVGSNEDGSAIKGILMRIPKELYNADQKLKQKEVDRVDEAIRKGKLEEQPGDKRYIPDGIKIWSNQNESG
jgi:hypothetical protein